MNASTQHQNTDAAATPLLQLKNISKTFPGVKALQNVDFDVRKGEVHGLCGENGAGMLIAFDSGVDSDLPLTTVSTDNTKAAEEAAKHMVELVGGSGTVGIVCHDVTSQTGKQRCDGFKNYIKTNAPDINLLPELVAGSVDEATNAAKSLIQSNADIKGIYGTNEAAATGAVQASIEVNKAGLQVVGFDSGKIQIEAIKDGKQAGAVTQSPVKMGYETVKAAVDAIDGKQLPKQIDSGFAWYDKSNIEDPDIAANLYE